jgi:DNA-binding CsgD family transcriptional regulator/pimeloyl-ACP methyl ester carboxylesterase
MTPPIRYARTADGVHIAFAELGAGPDVICMPPLPFSHIEEAWRLPGAARWYERLARDARVLLYDARGTGLSDREGEAAADVSLEAMRRDLDAVIVASQAARPALVGFFNSGPVAISYAARGETEVASLVLWGGYARGVDVYPLAPSIPSGPSGARLVEAQWGALAESAARSWTADPEEAQATARYFGACVSAQGLLRYAAGARGWDVTAQLKELRVPALVVQRRDTAAQNPELARRLAAAIAGAELQLLPGAAASPFSGDVDAGVDAVARFLGLGLGLGGSGASRAASMSGGEPPSLPAMVTARETEVLALLARGLANKEIAARLGVSVNTVERHLTNLYPKIGARGRTEATAFAIRHGLA